jgi:putative transposase
LTHKQRKNLIVPSHPHISVRRQTKLMGVSRASLYYEPKINALDQQAMNALDRLYTAYPFLGVVKMQETLKREHDISIGRDHTRRLLRLMGLEAIYPKKSRKTSIPDKQHEVYPYLIKHITAQYPNHIWGSDICYIPLESGWCYLYAIMDWFSRFVPAWGLSSTLESAFCIEAMTDAIHTYQPPHISNTDQGSQMTSKEFTTVLKKHDVRISMDGRGRYMDNIFTERLWRSVKYEEVYLKSYADINDAQTQLNRYFQFYNHHRPHQSLKYKTPAEVYYTNKLNKKRHIADRRLTTKVPSS